MNRDPFIITGQGDHARRWTSDDVDLVWWAIALTPWLVLGVLCL